MELILGIITILGFIFAAYKIVYKINHKLDKVIKMQPIVMQSLFACLDGLHQLGANGRVTETKEKLLKTLINE